MKHELVANEPFQIKRDNAVVNVPLDASGTLALKSDATLTPVYSNTPTYSEWVCDPATVQYGSRQVNLAVYVDNTSNPQQWCLNEVGVYQTPIATLSYNETATNLVFSLPPGFDVFTVTATRTRTDIIGYTLGAQTTKQLASLDYAMRIDPETGGIYYTTPDTNA